MTENDLMDKIKDYAVQESQKAFGFAGVAEGDKMVIINTGGSGEEQLIIKMDIK